MTHLGSVSTLGLVLLIACGGNSSSSPDAADDGAPNDGGDVGEGTDSGMATDASVVMALEAYIKPSNTNADDNFGFRIALSADGNTLAVGAYFEDSAATGIGGSQTDNTAENSGAVYVFKRTGSSWMQEAYLKASNSEARDFFGSSLALAADGNTLAVGASGEDSGNGSQADNTVSESGAAYVFTRAGATWSQAAYLKASNPGVVDNFGRTLALSADGSTLAAGAFFEDSAATGVGGNAADNSAQDSGAVYVFARSGQSWTPQAYVKASNTASFDYFAQSLALSADGNTLAVSASSEDSSATGIAGNQADNAALQSGAVYVYTRAGTSWSQQAYVKASNTGTGDLFGHSIALSASGDVLAVGALREDSAATGIGGNQTDESAQDGGAVYLFTRAGASWSQQAYVKASNPGSGDGFGCSVSLSIDGTGLAASACSEDSNATGVGGNQANDSASGSGAVYTFARAGSVWSQQAYVKASNTNSGDNFGESVALSGGTLAVGANLERSAAIGIGGNQADNSAASAGAVYIFR